MLSVVGVLDDPAFTFLLVAFCECDRFTKV